MNIMLPLQFFLPEQHCQSVSDPLAPLGIAFPKPNQFEEEDLQNHDIDFESEIAWMMKNLPSHPLVGSVAASSIPPSEAPRPTGRTSQGGERAEEIAAEFPPEPSGIPQDEEYPESVADYPEVTL